MLIQTGSWTRLTMAVTGVACYLARAAGSARPELPSLVLPDCARPHIIAHRGASGYLPEHTNQAYRLAIDLGVDYIEPDLVMTKDGHLICRHDVDLSETTDVAARPEFKSRRRNVTLTHVQKGEGASEKHYTFTGFFSFDFTLAEIKTLRAKQRLHHRSSAYDGLFEVPTFEEVVHMVREAEKATGRRVGIYAEIKEPYFFKQNGFDIEGKLVQALDDMGFLIPPPSRPSPTDFTADVPQPMIIQCFDPEALQSLAERIPTMPLVQLLAAPTSSEPHSISQTLGRETQFGDIPLDAIAAYASGVGPEKAVFTTMVPEAARAIVDEAHALGLGVHPWTFRREEVFIDRAFKDDSEREMDFFYACLNVDALFVEFPDQASHVILQMLTNDEEGGAMSNENEGTMDVVAAGVEPGMAMTPAFGQQQEQRSPFSLVLGAATEEEGRKRCLELRKARSCTYEPLARVSPRWLRSKPAAATSVKV